MSTILPAPALQLPRTLFARGAIASLGAELAALNVRRPLLITDQGIVRAGLAAKAIAALGNGAAPAAFDNVTENPTFADVDYGAALYRNGGCDGVVALGGGSVIDTAKIVALLAKNPGGPADYVGVLNVPHVAGAPLVVIPTTAGTGSEVSASSGVHSALSVFNCSALPTFASVVRTGADMNTTAWGSRLK